MQKDGIKLNVFILILLFIPLVSQDTSLIVKLKVNKIGSVQLLNSSYVPNPDQILIGDEVKGTSTNTITVGNTEDEIQLIWTNKLTDCNSMFRGMKDITEIDFSLFDSSDVTDMQLMFANCISLRSINLSNLNTINVVNMNQLFFNCRSLISLDVSNFQTSKVKSMVQMFAYCNSLESLDLSKFNTQSNENFLSMFSNCFNLKFLNLTGMTTKASANFGYMFCNCSSLTSLDISHFESGSAFLVSTGYMFYNCSSLTYLDLSNFLKTDTTVNQYIMFSMFRECKNLRYLNFNGKSNSLTNNILDNTPENMVGCFPDDSDNRDFRTLFLSKSCTVLDCSENWEANQKKINGETGACMDSCSGDFLYEYNTKCLRECPQGTKDIETQYLCEEITIDDEIINTTNEVLETIELSFENEEEEEEINESENDKEEIYEKEKLKKSDIVTDNKEYENEIGINTIENTEEKVNKDSNTSDEKDDKNDLKAVIISIGVSLIVVFIVCTILIIFYVKKFLNQRNNPVAVSSVNPQVNSNMDNPNHILEGPQVNKIGENPINIYNVRFDAASLDPEYSKDISKNQIINNLKK